MKLKKGQTVHIGREKFVGEIPDEIAKKFGLLKDRPKEQPKEDADKK
jgi:hypothetical protein